jgi:hypothetical protein
MCRPVVGGGAGAVAVAVAVGAVAVGGGALAVAHAVAEMMPVLVGGEVMVAVVVVSLAVWRVMVLLSPPRVAVRGDNDGDMVRVNSWRHQSAVAAPRRAELPPAGHREDIPVHGLSLRDIAARKETQS